MSRYIFYGSSKATWPPDKDHDGDGMRERTDYDRINPICLMLSDCDLAIIDKHKSEDQDPRDFLQRLVSENLRVLRDRTP